MSDVLTAPPPRILVPATPRAPEEHRAWWDGQRGMNEGLFGQLLPPDIFEQRQELAKRSREVVWNFDPHAGQQPVLACDKRYIIVDCGRRWGKSLLAVRWAVDEALRRALVNLESVAAPAGEMPVVLGPGWPGILLHEAVGHGLEGDFNRKGTSAFAGLLGQRVAAPGVTVIDDGTIADRRGSISIDDEGTPSARNVLIKDGILKGFIQDRLNARLMGVKPTGNGRRQSYAHAPMPRMTNTCMLGGAHEPAEIVASVKKGLYAVNFGGGQVDITSGKFVFSCTEAYLIENGKVGAPVKGATLIATARRLTRVPCRQRHATRHGRRTMRQGRPERPRRRRPATIKVDSLTVGGRRFKKSVSSPPRAERTKGGEGASGDGGSPPHRALCALPLRPTGERVGKAFALIRALPCRRIDAAFPAAHHPRPGPPPSRGRGKKGMAARYFPPPLRGRAGRGGDPIVA